MAFLHAQQVNFYEKIILTKLLGCNVDHCHSCDANTTMTCLTCEQGFKLIETDKGHSTCSSLCKIYYKKNLSDYYFIAGYILIFSEIAVFGAIGWIFMYF